MKNLNNLFSFFFLVPNSATLSRLIISENTAAAVTRLFVQCFLRAAPQLRHADAQFDKFSSVASQGLKSRCVT